MVFQVTERQDFDAETFAKDSELIRQELQNQRFQSLRRANLQQLRERHGDSILMNDAVLAPLREQQQSNPLNPLG